MNSTNNYKPCDLVIFGALGDLSRRKLLISLYKLDEANLLEPDTRIIGVDRIAQDNKGFSEIAHKSLLEFHSPTLDKAVWDRLSARFAYIQLDINDCHNFKN